MRVYDMVSLESRFTFGRYRGLTLADVIDLNPTYVVWCVLTVLEFRLHDTALEEMQQVYPYFPFSYDFERCRVANLLRSFEDDFDEGDDREDYYASCSSYDEDPTYDRYNGSYAQDVMGYSDDDIDTIFDSDPSAYWNID